MSTRTCPSCGAPISADETECKYCGEKLEPEKQLLPQQPSQYAPPQYGAPQYAPPQYAPPQYAPPQYGTPLQNPPAVYTSTKDKTTAGLLAIFLGGLGAHKFYLDRPKMGILYLLFCWTWIPEIIGFFEGIIYLFSSNETFYEKYVKQ